MRTMYVEMSAPRFVLTRTLGRLTSRAYFAATSPLHLAHLPDPPLPAADWVRVRNHLCGICGSDLHQIFLDASLDVAPVALPSHQRIYLGHEMVGTIVEAGPHVDGFAVGDRVVRWGRGDDCVARGAVELCPACQRGHRVLCERASEIRTHDPVGGGFGDTFVTPAATLLPVPPVLSDEQAIFSEPLAVAIHAAWRRRPESGEQVLVLGCGTIGFLLIQVLRMVQPDCAITAVAEFDWQAMLARSFGATHVVMAREDGYTQTATLTGARLYTGRRHNRMLLGGYDVVFDVVGSPRSVTDALRWTRAGGTVVLVGVNLHRMTVDLTPVWYQEVDLRGAVGHDVVTWQGETRSTFEWAMRWMANGAIETQRLLTHRFPLDNYRAAFDAALDKRTHRSIKVAFDC